MKKVVIAFDIDGTLRNNNYKDAVVANERIRTLLITLASFKNVRILVWSGGGELYARQIAGVLGISKYVDSYADKEYVKCPDCLEPCDHHRFGTAIKPDIAIDDIQDCDLGKINLTVREK